MSQKYTFVATYASRIRRHGSAGWWGCPQWLLCLETPGVSQHQQQDARLTTQMTTIFRRSRQNVWHPQEHAEFRAQGIRWSRAPDATGAIGGPPAAYPDADDKESSRPADRALTPEAPNQKWAVDSTSLATQEGWLYLAVVVDLLARRVVGRCRQLWSVRWC